MKIAIPYDRGRIDPHFGHAQYFEVYTVTEGKIEGRMVLPAKGSGHAYMSSLMRKMNVAVVIAGNMGKPAILALREYGIDSYIGLSGSSENAVLEFLDGNLKQFDTKNLDLSKLDDGCGCHQ